MNLLKQGLGKNDITDFYCPLLTAYCGNGCGSQASVDQCVQKYRNPYNFGGRQNWRIFLGLTNGRSVVFEITLSYNSVQFNRFFSTRFSEVVGLLGEIILFLTLYYILCKSIVSNLGELSRVGSSGFQGELV